MSNLTLGLDIGASSVGWALASGEDGNKELIDYNSHIFKEALVVSGMNANGKTPASERRLARQMRRRYERIRQRKNNVIKIMREHELLPEHITTIQGVSAYLKSLPSENIFKLRSDALHLPMADSDIFRIVYSIANRRGISTRYTIDEKEAKVISEALAGVRNKMVAGDFKTVGEMIYKSTFVANGDRYRNSQNDYRNSYTFDMMSDEIHHILTAQKALGNSKITDNLITSLQKAIFFQRPLKSVEHMVGFCQYEHHHGKKRAAKATFSFFRYTLLQELYNKTLEDKETGETKKAFFFVGAENYKDFEHSLLMDMSSSKTKEVSITKLKKLIGNKNIAYQKIGSGGEQKIEVSNTAAHLYSLLSTRFNENQIIETQNIIAEKLSAEMDDKVWNKNLSEFHSDIHNKIKDLNLTTSDFSGYGALSVDAMDKMSSEMMHGYTPYEAKERCGYTKSLNTHRFSFLPPLTINMHTKEGIKYLSEVLKIKEPSLDINTFIPFRDDGVSPKVKRIIAETRKVINYVIMNYGVPDRIIIETARDTNTASEKEKIVMAQKKNEAINKRAALKIEEYGAVNTRKNRRKYKLWEEQGGAEAVCAYSGETISLNLLFTEGVCEIEHVVPRSKVYIDAHFNVVLVKTKYNQEKGSRYHTEYLKSIGQWDNFCLRIRNSNMSEKKQSWLLDENIEETASKIIPDRYLTETKYASSMIMRYLNYYLYPSEDIHRSGTERNIFNINGSGTALLRRLWGKGEEQNKDDSGVIDKSRSNYYHHTIDAVVLCGVSSSMVHNISNYYRQKENGVGRKHLKALASPFKDNVRVLTDNIKAEYENYERYVHHSQRFSFNKQGIEATALGAKINPETGVIDKDSKVHKRVSLQSLFDEQFIDKKTKKLCKSTDFEAQMDKALAGVIDSDDEMITKAALDYFKKRYELEKSLEILANNKINDKKSDQATDSDIKDANEKAKKELIAKVKDLNKTGGCVLRGKRNTPTYVKSVSIVNKKRLGNHFVIAPNKSRDSRLVYNTDGVFRVDIYRSKKDGKYYCAPQYFDVLSGKVNYIADTRTKDKIELNDVGVFEKVFELFGGESVLIQEKGVSANIYRCGGYKTGFGQVNIADQNIIKNEIPKGVMTLSKFEKVSINFSGKIRNSIDWETKK